MRSRPLHRRSSSGPRKLKCHSIGLRVMLSQSPIPGKRCIDHHPARDPDRILSSQRIADHIADVMCDQVCLLDLECIHDAGNVDRLVSSWRSRYPGDRTYPCRAGRGRSRYGPWPEQLPGGPTYHPYRRSHATAPRRTLAADSDVEAGAVRRNHLRVKAGWKRRDSRHEGR